MKKTKIKRYRRYAIPTMWLIGMIERETKKIIIVPVKTRDKEALIPIVLKYVSCKTTIFTDCYSVYANNRKTLKGSMLIDYGYNHQFVDHSVEFVSNYFDHIHTNTIERLWRTIKTDIKNKRITVGFLRVIARFYFHKTLSKEKQVKIIAEHIYNYNK